MSDDESEYYSDSVQSDSDNEINKVSAKKTVIPHNATKKFSGYVDDDSDEDIDDAINDDSEVDDADENEVDDDDEVQIGGADDEDDEDDLDKAKQEDEDLARAWGDAVPRPVSDLYGTF